MFEGAIVNRGMGLVLFGMIAALSGCATSTTDDGQQAARSAGGLMPAVTPSQDASYAADQKQVKLLGLRTISYDEYETFIKTASESKPESDVALLTDIDAPPKTEDAPAEEDDAGAEFDDTADEVATPVIAELVDGRPMITEVPAHPGGLTGSSVDDARAAAETAARANMVRTVLAYQVNPATTVADLLDAELSEVELDMLSAQVVKTTWLDEKTLEVEIQIPVGDIVSELERKFSEADFSPLKSIDQGKYFAAKGVGKI